MIHFFKLIIFFIFISLIFVSCSDNNDTRNEIQDENLEDFEDDEGGKYHIDENSVKYEDGTYSASVDYYNPNTGYQATYTLDVEIEDGKIVKIYFPNDGYLDDTHIDETEIDEDGKATIIDDENREFEIEIDD